MASVVEAKQSPPLEVVVEQVKSLLATEDFAVAQVRYQVGSIVRRIIEDTDRYGNDAIAKIAAAVGRDTDSLYDYAAVASTWSEEAFPKLFRQARQDGLRLSFSHFVELAKRSRRGRLALEPASREELRAKALEQRWSVAQLKDAIRTEMTASVETRDASPDEVGHLRKTTSTWLDRGKRVEDLLAVLERRGLTPPDRDAAATALEQLERMRSLCELLAGRLNGLLQGADSHAARAGGTSE